MSAAKKRERFAFPWQHIVDRLCRRGVYTIVLRHAQRSGVSIEDICGRDRTQSVAGARHAVWKEFSRMGLSNCEIARIFDRDPTTVLAALSPVRRAKNRERNRAAYRASRAA